MTAIYAPIDKRVRSRILHGARQAASLDCMPNIIYDAIVAFNVDYSSVELDEIKSVLVDAVRAYRSARYPKKRNRAGGGHAQQSSRCFNRQCNKDESHRE
ncbi:MAG: hypothetical protein IH991_23805 [Planctomycetes bacterium]|nr:hypothetical protein [Planctomycetota bacterium]